MAGSNNENLIRTFKKDEVNPIFDMFKSVRPKTVKNRGKITFLTELSGERSSRISLAMNKKNLEINEENPNNIPETKTSKRKTMGNIFINFNFTGRIKNQNLNSINEDNNPINDLSKIKKTNNNKILPKLNLESINETNTEAKIVRRNKRNKTTMVMNLNFGHKSNKEEQEENEEKEEKEIPKNIVIKRQITSMDKIKVKNYFSKNDFCYFN